MKEKTIASSLELSSGHQQLLDMTALGHANGHEVFLCESLSLDQGVVKALLNELRGQLSQAQPKEPRVKRRFSRRRASAALADEFKIHFLLEGCKRRKGGGVVVKLW